ncbi:SDR family NAD(P)-dependent oxidoreductase [Pandoraea apista]|uniref:SDR family oxidoreductase n=1 Tax=Pandoraea apista TaxID=93218 RepID=A0ABX9ZR75_9BURK|nr:SDR family oxidoreductase [Pandoraea apista]ALS64830.1 oxidoreductase [Pandoraea apista]AVF41416.1 NAD(P)-dependent oxidoreductase [Pandoraea apista]PTE00492.1 NAD(P)-dependent oxidoreductase [Pandoraea apista]RRJ28778.1 SDR family oxidoreductase [Pandoraea apista]RRJ73733.1 SDR family oxidoreductase [Pandoraea apista]
MNFPVCLVTGAATGIGAATALRFAREGWAVAINNFDDSTRAAAESVAAQCRDAGAQTLVIDADVGDDAACRHMASAVGAQWGRLDALVNSAGTTRVIPHSDLEAIDDAEFERIYRVNLIGMFQMTRAAAGLLRERPAGASSAAVINISSLASLNGTGSSIAYAASKGAVNSLTLSLARNLAPQVRVNAIAPGMVDDGLLRRVLGDDAYARVVDGMRENAPLKRVSQPSEIADLAWFLAAHAPAMTGQVLAIENGLLLNT